MRVKEYYSKVKEVHRCGHVCSLLNSVPRALHILAVMDIIDDNHRLVVCLRGQYIQVTQSCLVRMVGVYIPEINSLLAFVFRLWTFDYKQRVVDVSLHHVDIRQSEFFPVQLRHLNQSRTAFVGSDVITCCDRGQICRRDASVRAEFDYLQGFIRLVTEPVDDTEEELCVASGLQAMLRHIAHQARIGCALPLTAVIGDVYAFGGM